MCFQIGRAAAQADSPLELRTCSRLPAKIIGNPQAALLRSATRQKAALLRSATRQSSRRRAETSTDDFSLLDAPSCCCAFFCQRIGSLIETFLVGFHHLYGTYRGPTWPIWDLYVTYRGQGTYIYTQYSQYGTYTWASGLIGCMLDQ